MDVATLDSREAEQISWPPGPSVRCVTPNQPVKYVQALKKADGVNRCTVILKSLVQFSLNRASWHVPYNHGQYVLVPPKLFD